MPTPLRCVGLAQLSVSMLMPIKPSSSTARGLSAVFLCAVGLLALIIGTIVFLPMKDRKSDPDPTVVQYAISMGVGSVILASSVACFVLAARLRRRSPPVDPPSDFR